MASSKPFTIAVPEARLDRLYQKLALTDFPHELDEAGWTYGAPLADVKRLAGYWQNGFDWRMQERKLNEMPQFQTTVSIHGFEEVNIHFVHQKSNAPGAIPLLFVHGWPGSFIEVAKLLPLLRGGNGAPAFHVVAPSLPNYGFSSRTTKKGFALTQYAEACHKVMQNLGYNEYVTQGGDWGFFITRAIAHLYPENCKGCHTNWAFANFPAFTKHPTLALTSLLRHALSMYTTSEAESLERLQNWGTGDGRGYLAEQSTKPQTIGYALTDSPVALLAWIYEKLHDWTDSYPWTDDEILTWISIYWFSTAGPAAASFIYYEALHDTKLSLAVIQGYIDVPFGLAYFPEEIGNAPKAWTQTLGPVVRISESDKGGHFAAWERPEVIADDLNKMFGKGGGASGVVKGKSGY